MLFFMPAILDGLTDLPGEPCPALMSGVFNAFGACPPYGPFLLTHYVFNRTEHTGASVNNSLSSRGTDFPPRLSFGGFSLPPFPQLVQPHL